MGSIFDLIFQSLGSIFGFERRDRRERKRQLAGQVVCGLRVIAGSEQGLRRGWRVRRAMVQPGKLEFAQRTPTSVQVRAVVTERQRRLHWRESRLILDTTWQIVELMTDSATLEWAVPEDKLEWAVARVRGFEISSV
jgi:hypothetical protein